MDVTFRSAYGPWALVTGAARLEGLGFEFARQLGSVGMNLILVDVLEKEVEARARELRESVGVEVLPVGMDLGRRDFLPSLMARVAVAWNVAAAPLLQALRRQQ